MKIAAVALALMLAAPEEQGVEQPAEPSIAPRWPGLTAFWVGGAMIGAASEITALGCLSCGTLSLRSQTLIVTSVSLVTTLAGMMWMVWRQPRDEEPSMTPGYAAMVMGLVQSVIGTIGFAIGGGSGDPQPPAMLIGAGLATIAAGIAWVVWGHRLTPG